MRRNVAFGQNHVALRPALVEPQVLLDPGQPLSVWALFLRLVEGLAGEPEALQPTTISTFARLMLPVGLRSKRGQVLRRPHHGHQVFGYAFHPSSSKRSP